MRCDDLIQQTHYLQKMFISSTSSLPLSSTVQLAGVCWLSQLVSSQVNQPNWNRKKTSSPFIDFVFCFSELKVVWMSIKCDNNGVGSRTGWWSSKRSSFLSRSTLKNLNEQNFPCWSVWVSDTSTPMFWSQKHFSLKSLTFRSTESKIFFSPRQKP